jgi:hypothetical protein
VLVFFKDYKTLLTSIIIMAAYGAHWPSQRLGLSDISNGRMVVSCPEKIASRLMGVVV